MRRCKCCGQTIEAEQLLVFEKCLWCSENCYAVHEEKPEHISEATASAGIPSLYINKVKRA